ncbi:MAG: hypothetical protein IPO22_14395 [Anaerolineales bacterium]|nr:hypothetical protein [Anaerolineales bacterium]
MNRKPSDVIPGLAIYLLIAVVTWLSVAMGVFPGRFEQWLSMSSNPQQALIFFSMIASSVVLILTRGGVEINLINMAKGENFKRYATGLPLWFLLIGLAVALLGFWNYSPRCKAPEAVVFDVIGTQQTYLPLDKIKVSPNQSITIGARSPEDNILLSCISWEFTGPAFQTLGEKNGCQVNITFGDQPGSSFITLLATQNFCGQASLFSLEVNLEKP